MNRPLPETPSDAADAVTEDALLDGRVRLLQPRRGYRAGLDAALLAAAVDLGPGERGLEAGCGVGAALLQVAARRPDATLVGVERDPAAAALARRNVALNGRGERVSVTLGDVRARFSVLGQPPFDAAFANPPFFDDPSVLRGPAPERQGAWLADGGLEAWVGFLLKAVREGGRITVIHRADRLGDLLSLLSAGAGSLQVRAVHPFADAPAKRVLVRAIKTGRAPLVLLPPWVLHAAGEPSATLQTDALLRGRADLGWR